MKSTENNLHHLFDEKVAANMAAAFLFLAGGELYFLKLMKLMYLAERKSYQLYAEPIVGDRMVSMNYGPVLSNTYNLIKTGSNQVAEGGWETWVSDAENYKLKLRKSLNSIEDLPMLSEAQIEIVYSIWSEFKDYDRFELAKHTHNICPEWEDPDGSMYPIDLSRLIKVLNYDDVAISHILNDLREQALIKERILNATTAS